MMTAIDAKFVLQVQLLRNQAMLVQYQNEMVSLNNRMTDLHAVIGRVQLPKITGWTRKLRGDLAFLKSDREGVTSPAVMDGAVHVDHQYTIKVESSDGADTNDLTFLENGIVPTELDAISQFRGVSEGAVTRYAIEKREPFRVEQERFRDAVNNGDTQIVTMEEGVKTLEAIQTILDSAASGRSVARV